MIVITAQFEYKGKALYTELTPQEELALKDSVRHMLGLQGADVAVVDIEDDGFG